jgi:hypothetical protein
MHGCVVLLFPDFRYNNINNHDHNKDKKKGPPHSCFENGFNRSATAKHNQIKKQKE